MNKKISFAGPWITDKEIENALRKLKNGKASPDEMKNELLKYGKEETVKILSYYFNEICRHKKTLPTSWRKGLITSIYKKGAKMAPKWSFGLLCKIKL